MYMPQAGEAPQVPASQQRGSVPKDGASSSEAAHLPTHTCTFE